MSAISIQEAEFRRRVDAALTQVKRVLDSAKQPCYAEDVAHKYDDKYALAEHIAISTLVSTFNTFSYLGLDDEMIDNLYTTTTEQDVTILLRFRAERSCVLDRKETIEEDSDTKHVTEVKGWLGTSTNITSKVVKTIHKWFWNVTVKYNLDVVVLPRGANISSKEVSEKSFPLRRREAITVVVTHSESPPYPQHHIQPQKDVELTRLVARRRPEKQSFAFRIQREEGTCRTPRNNREVQQLMDELKAVYPFLWDIGTYFINNVFQIQQVWKTTTIYETSI